MLALLIAALGGLFVTIQVVFNTHSGNTIGAWEGNFVTFCGGTVVSLIIMLIFGSGSFSRIGQIPWYYYTGGIFGVFIVYCSYLSVIKIGPVMSMAIMLVAQLASATVIEWFGLFGSVKNAFNIRQPIGIAIMLLGAYLLKK